MSPRTTMIIAAAAGVSTLLSGTLRADVVGQYDGFFNPYWYWATDVPDFDQSRNGLPLGGSVHCVPAATLNWMAYIANHGAPEVAPGTGYWQSQGRYTEATLAMLLMGVVMGTDEDGTGLDGGFDGIVAWLNSSTSKPFLITTMGRDLGWAPRLHNLVANGEFQGLVMPSIGWYEEEGAAIDRDGGHRVTMTYGAQSASFVKKLGFTDPSTDDNDMDAQSNFVTDLYTVVDVERSEFIIPVWRSKIVGYKSGSKQGYVDAVTTIRPLWILSPSPNYNFGGLFSWLLNGSGESGSFELAGGDEPIVDFAIHADGYTTVFISADPDGDATVWVTDPSMDEPQCVELGFTDPTRLTVGARRGLYVVDGEEIVLVNLDGPEGPEERARVALPSRVDAMSYDDFEHRVGLLSVDDRTLTLVPEDLGIHWDVPVIPDAVPLGGECDIAWDPETKGWLVVSQAENKLYRLDWDGANLVPNVYAVEGLEQPRSVSVGDGGRVFVYGETGLHELVLTDEGGYEQPTAPLFPTFEPAGPVRVARSRTNFDSSIHDGPAWKHVLPTEYDGEHIAYCVPDFDGDRIIGFSDLITLLSSWGPCDPAFYCFMDVDYDGVIGFGDLIVLLSQWGACP